MSIYDKTDRWDEKNAGRPLPPTRQQLEAKVDHLTALLEATIAERDRLKAALDEAAEWIGTADIETDLPKMRDALSDPSGEKPARAAVA